MNTPRHRPLNARGRSARLRRVAATVLQAVVVVSLASCGRPPRLPRGTKAAPWSSAQADTPPPKAEDARSKR
jgi:hypothetical protein